ncbi:MAG: Lysine-tRNA ligase [candidate division TM6 bacterium GW2011_GWF2_32_72]|nr:MAG: Lysine-tRNA ligase [candidate division TM6 bacterium GW2011_GWF2_32_72]
MSEETKTSQGVLSPEAASAEHLVRVEKIKEMTKVGMQPWPEFEQLDSTCKQVVDEFDQAQGTKVYKIAGRIVSFRLHGKTSFAHIQDRTGKVQIYVRQDVVGDKSFENYEKFVDLGDYVFVEGASFKTKTGEISIRVSDWKLLSKCLHPLPEKFHGLTDVEVKYRQRYLDLISNEESRNRFKVRSGIIKYMRNYFDSHGFMEVETPMLHPIPGGAAARPFVTHHNALDTELFLRIAPELYLKRLVIGGFERVFEINRNFRNEGISTRHNPEFTMVEFYCANTDYHQEMNFIESMIKDIAQKTCGTLQVNFAGKVLDFEKPFARISMQGSVSDALGYEVTESNVDKVLKEKNIDFDPKKPFGDKVVLLFEELVEPGLFQPTFIIDYPIEISPLAKRDANNPNVAARFELFIGGMEISNGFNELNDPFDQASRFKDQAKAHEAGDEEAHHYDAEFITALEYGLPPAAGAGIGIDRLTMLLTDTTSIKDVILFPTLKKKI